MGAIATFTRTLYALSAGFALLTAYTSTLLPHRAWGAVAVWGYALAFLLAFPLWRRLALVAAVFATTTLLPLVIQAVERASGRTDRAQEEVHVVEQMGQRLLDTGTPYLDRPAIAALDVPLLGYAPYQPGMSVFGLPRAAFGTFWWTDARVWFAVATVAALVWTLRLLDNPFVVALAVAALPICALTLATGGDDLPVLALCLLALAFTTRDRFVAAGVAVGLAAALKLFALPVAAVLVVLAWRSGRLRRFAPYALGLPALAMLPVLLVSPPAFVENVLRFPAGHGLVTSPAQSPLPGQLIASATDAGRTIALGLLLLAGTLIGWWLLRRPPTDAAAAALVITVGLTAAIMLIPSTRFGYFLYPAGFAALWWSQRRAVRG